MRAQRIVDIVIFEIVGSFVEKDETETVKMTT